MNGIKGLSIIYHSKAIKYMGKYVAGLFSDNNYEYRNPVMKGWGFKFDVYIGPLVRPVPRFWQKSFWTSKPKIWDVVDGDFFNAKIKSRLEEKRMKGAEPGVIPKSTDVNDFKFGCLNPWKGRPWFVLRVPTFIFAFFSLSTPWRSFYIGFKTSKIDPFLDNPYTVDQGDYTWCEKNERKLAEKAGGKMFRSAVPSMSVRKVRT